MPFRERLFAFCGENFSQSGMGPPRCGHVHERLPHVDLGADPGHELLPCHLLLRGVRVPLVLV